MKKNSLISIIIPVYNAEKYIERCIDSILNQTYNNIEIIVINDGSKDLSWEKLKKYKNKKNVILVNQSNSGAATTRNRGISLATGKYIMFIDNDDYISNDYIENYVKNIGDYDVLLGGYERRDINNKKLFKKNLPNSKWGKYEIMAPWARMIRKKILLENEVKFYDFRIGEDIVFNLDLYNVTNKVKTFSYNGYIWFYNHESISNTKQKKIDADIIILLNEMKKYSGNKEVDYYILRYVVWYLLYSTKNSSSKEFMAEYKKVFDWLNENEFNYAPVFIPFKYENQLKNKIVVSIFLLFSKLHLIKLFSKIYCKS